jgi:hypothetical protein
MTRPTYSYREIIYLIDLSNTQKDIALIDSLIMEEKKKYSITKLRRLRAILLGRALEIIGEL